MSLFANQTRIVCPKCGMVSHNPNDIEQRYCGSCHAFHDDLMAAQQFQLPDYCYSCGAYLMGGATKHKPGCEILRLIEEGCEVLRLIKDSDLPGQGRELKVSDLRPHMMVWLAQAVRRNQADQFCFTMATVRVGEVSDQYVRFFHAGAANTEVLAKRCGPDLEELADLTPMKIYECLGCQQSKEVRP